MYPFTRHSDYLQLESHRTWNDEGLNYINIREVFYDLEHITTENIFTSINSGLTISGEWVIDGGDTVMPANEREKRTFCRKGKASFTFTGTSLQVRVYTQPTYGSADVRIDGVLPSTLANVKDPVDILSCDANDYDETWGQEYINVTIVNNIADEEHTVELYCENAGTGLGDWFPISGYKVSESDSRTGERDCYIQAVKGSCNKEELSIWNRIPGDGTGGKYSVVNISIIFNSLFVDENGTALGTKEYDYILQDQHAVIEFWPDIQGTEQEQTFSDTFEITASYEDPDGVVEYDWGTFGTYADDYPDLVTYSDLQVWAVDEVFGYTLARVDRIGQWLEVEFYGTYVDVWGLKIQHGGVFNVHIDDIYKGIVDCDGGDEDFYLFKTTFSGLSNTDHKIKLTKIDSTWGEGHYSFFHHIEWQENRTYTEVIETITYNFPSVQVPPFAPDNPRFLTYADKNPTCDPVNLGMVDYNIPRDNAGVNGLWVEKRPATFAVCYQAGFEDILKTYDILILEPRALTRKKVKEFQDLGIKVFCYHSYGAETGTYLNPWDSGSGLVPYTGDGEGPGGYASYYNKGGNQFGECSECKHDRRRLEDVTKCALNQTNFYAVWAGRCSNACTKDWRTGYEAYSIGGNCGGGYNSGNNWSRTATKACTNSDCDQYNPVHGACQFYETPDDYMFGQDYSMFTPDWPDEDGIWKSFFVNTTAPAWSEKIKNHYLPTIFGDGEEIVESVTVNTFQTEVEEITVDGFRITRYPIDVDEDVVVENLESGFTFIRGTDYHFDGELGIFKFFATDNKPSWGDVLQITYTTKGLQADGIFLDTIDTVDIYSSDAYKDAMVNIIGEHHSLYPDKTWVMNRGFTILERLMPFTDFVMFESFISTINWETGEYYEITDPATIAAVQVFIDLLFRLREIYTFNVLGLNYCDNDDDELRQIITDGVRQYGWLSWTSEISLNDPQENEEIFTKDLYIESNAWRLTDELDLP